MKKITSISLAVILMLSIILGIRVNYTQVSAAIDFTKDYELIELNKEAKVSIENINENVVLKFVPSESGMYNFSSINALAFGFIYDSNGTLEAASENIDVTYNITGPFSVDHVFEAGKVYYLEISTHRYQKEDYSVIITKYNYPETVSIDGGEEQELGIGLSRQLSVSFAPENTMDTIESWTSDNAEVLAVDEKGTVLAKSLGSATITTTTKSGLTDTIKITVTDQPEVKIGEDIGHSGLKNTKCYKFVPEYDGKYRVSTIGVDGTAAIKILVMDEKSKVLYGDMDREIVLDCDLDADKTYYISINSYEDDYAYNFITRIEAMDVIIPTVAPTDIPTATPKITGVPTVAPTINPTDAPSESPDVTIEPDKTEIPATESFKLGDVNCDSCIDASDALDVLKCASKLSELKDSKLADTNNDGNIDADDALQILKLSAKLIDSFKFE